MLADSSLHFIEPERAEFFGDHPRCALFAIGKLGVHVKVAALFNRSAHWWHKTGRARLEARGFPAPIDGGNYDPRAVDAWILLQMPPELRAVSEAARAAWSTRDEAERRARQLEQVQMRARTAFADIKSRRKRRAS